MIMPINCLVCMDRRCEVRLTCGHLVSCWLCLQEGLACCPLCRQEVCAIDASSTGTNTFTNRTVGSDISESEYANKCFTCRRDADWIVRCAPCHTQDLNSDAAPSRSTTLMLCVACLSHGCCCPVCGGVLSSENIHSEILRDFNSVGEWAISGSSVGTSLASEDSMGDNIGDSMPDAAVDGSLASSQ